MEFGKLKLTALPSKPSFDYFCASVIIMQLNMITVA